MIRLDDYSKATRPNALHLALKQARVQRAMAQQGDFFGFDRRSLVVVHQNRFYLP